MTLHSTSDTSYDRPRRVPLLPVAAVAAALLVTGGVVMTTVTGDPVTGDPVADNHAEKRAAVVDVLDDAIGESHGYGITVTGGVGGEAVTLP